MEYTYENIRDIYSEPQTIQHSNRTVPKNPFHQWMIQRTQHIAEEFGKDFIKADDMVVSEFDLRLLEKINTAQAIYIQVTPAAISKCRLLVYCDIYSLNLNADSIVLSAKAEIVLTKLSSLGRPQVISVNKKAIVDIILKQFEVDINSSHDNSVKPINELRKIQDNIDSITVRKKNHAFQFVLSYTNNCISKEKLPKTYHGIPIEYILI